MGDLSICILFASPNKNGNTATLLAPFITELTKFGVTINFVDLFEKQLAPCEGCYDCQSIRDKPGCSISDDMKTIYNLVLDSQCIVFVTPIYTWYCTAPMKSVIDRLFALNKFYGGNEYRGSLWKNKKIALVSTCGYRVEYGVDLFEEGLKRLAKHSELQYFGSIVASDQNEIGLNHQSIISESKQFAQKIYSELSINHITKASS